MVFCAAGDAHGHLDELYENVMRFEYDLRDDLTISLRGLYGTTP